jgi:uncharacterized damage-inducible protein DinB
MTQSGGGVRYGSAMNGRLLADAFGHNVWATIKLIDTCLALSEEQLQTPVPGTYGSIIATMRHTVGADRSYLALLSTGGITEIDEDSMDLAELRAAMAETGPVWSALLALDLDPAAMVVRHRDDGSTSGAPLGVRLAQVIHHGTDHRSQVCTALTNLGIEPPEIDVWSYAWDAGRLTETEPTT